jgi:thioester reductase-like protein
MKLKPKLDFIQIRQATVFLTSITGFLGSQILRTLLEHPEIGCVIGLVRAKDEEQARRKVQHHAELGRWWQPGYQDRIEVWIGDLSKPKLGLEESKWNHLFPTDTRRIDGIIHNGARVNWMDSYEDLELVNIHSTINILSGLSKMETPCTLIYISGGYMSMGRETHGEIARKLSKASGYDQTKFMSQLLLTEYNKHLTREDTNAKKARTVIPGFIVGTQKEGIAHTEDFLWRLAFSIIRLKAISKDFNYITVAGVDQVANLITDVFLQPEQYSSEAINCVDGVRVSTFCDALSKQMQMPIERMDHKEWMQLLQADVEEADFDHPFMPVLRWFEENTWQFMGDQDSVPENCYFDQKETIVALESSVKYLTDVGYLSHNEPSRKQLDNTAVFSRSRS